MNTSHSALRTLGAALLAVFALARCGPVEDEAFQHPDTAADIASREDLLTTTQKKARCDVIKSEASAKTVTNALVIAGVANHETGLAHCWSEATWACQGPSSSDCGGPVIAGAGDGACSLQQGGLGMFQFDSGTYTDTLNAYGSSILSVGGNARAGVDYIIDRVVMRCPNMPTFSSRAAGISWLNAAKPGTSAFETYVDAITWCYNGCSPTGCSIFNTRRAEYKQHILDLQTLFGNAYWYPTTPPTPTYDDAKGDYNGDNKADYALFRPSDGTWHIKFSPTDVDHTFQWGTNGDQPFSGDFSNDGKDDQVLFRPSTSTWYVRFSSDGSQHSFTFGTTGDIPLLGGDLSGDGAADAVVFRPSTSIWYVRFSQDASQHSFQFGTTGDKPLLGGDFDGDGNQDAVLFRPSTSTWYVRFSKDGSQHSFSFGTSTDIPLLGRDYDGDGVADATLFRPSTGTWYVRLSTDGVVRSFQFGANGDIPMAVDFTGDGKTDQVLYRPSTGTWYVRNSVTGAYTSLAYGTSTDLPVR